MPMPFGDFAKIASPFARFLGTASRNLPSASERTAMIDRSSRTLTSAPATDTPLPSTTIPETVVCSRDGSAPETMEPKRKPVAAARLRSNERCIESLRLRKGSRRSRSDSDGSASRSKSTGSRGPHANFSVRWLSTDRGGTFAREALPATTASTAGGWLRSLSQRPRPFESIGPAIPAGSIFSVEEPLPNLPIKP